MERCSVDGCEAPSRNRGMCSRHYERVRRTGSPHPPDGRKEPARKGEAWEFFQRQLATGDRSSGCWIWPYLLCNGYPVTYRSGKKLRVHRLAWEAGNGPLPEGQVVCHTCDTPSCFNPDHLFAGSKAENSADMARKERSGNQKLTAAEAKEILALKGVMPGPAVAAQYGVSHEHVYGIWNGRVRRHH